MVTTQPAEQAPQDASTYDRLIALLDKHNAQYRLIDHPAEGRTEIVSAMRGNELKKAAALILNQLQTPAGVAQVREQFLEMRHNHAEAELWPEVAVEIVGEDYLRTGDLKTAIEIFKLNLLAYPDSADANDGLAAAYLDNGQKDLARQYAQKALALLDAHTKPASSWSNTEPRRGRIRSSAEHTLKQTSEQAR